MTEYFAIGDVHGKADMLDELLQHWDGRSQLVFLGDLIDRGEDSRAVLERVKNLVDQKGAVCLSGNHEYMFLTWLDNPEKSYDHYRRKWWRYDDQFAFRPTSQCSCRWTSRRGTCQDGGGRFSRFYSSDSFPVGDRTVHFCPCRPRFGAERLARNQ